MTIDRSIRIMTGYGPQETWDLEVKMKFFCALEEKIAKAANEGKSLIIMGDLNSKLGPEYIRKDPKEITENGKILAGIMERNALSVVNRATELRIAAREINMKMVYSLTRKTLSMSKAMKKSNKPLENTGTWKKNSLPEIASLA